MLRLNVLVLNSRTILPTNTVWNPCIIHLRIHFGTVSRHNSFKLTQWYRVESNTVNSNNKLGLFIVLIIRRSYLVTTYLVPTHLVSTFFPFLLLITHKLLYIRATPLHTFIKENKYLENDIEFIRIKPIVWE